MANSGYGTATGPVQRLISAGKAGAILGVQAQTIAAWEKLGAISAVRTGGGHRRFNRADIIALRDGKKTETKEKVILYCRVSTSNQKTSLANQIKRVTAYAEEKHKGKELILFSEVGSGFSAERKELWKMLDKILLGEFDNATLICSSRERLSRFICEVFEKICERHSITVEYIERETDDDEKTFSADLIACVTWWTVRYSAKKAAQRQSKAPPQECIERGLQLINEGHSSNLIHELLNSEGFSVSRHTVRKYIFTKREHLAAIAPSALNSAIEYRKACIESASHNHRTVVADLVADYQQWCGANGLVVLTKRMFMRQFSDFRILTFTTTDNPNSSRTCYAGFSIKGKPELTRVIVPQKRKETPANTKSLECLLKFSDGLRGKELYSKKIQLNYQSYCKGQKIKPLARKDIFRHLDRLCVSKRNNGAGFLYQF